MKNLSVISRIIHKLDDPYHLKRMTADQMRMKDIAEYHNISHIERVDCSQAARRERDRYPRKIVFFAKTHCRS